MAADTDPVLDQLKKLREGNGLSADRLGASPAVLSSLATSDPKEGFDALRLILERLGDNDRTRALRVDFGLNLDELLGRAPTSREADRLGERRAGYAELVGRDVKTLGRWSDKAIAELRAQLLHDFFDGHVVIAAGVQAGRTTGVEIIRYDRTDEHFSEGRTLGYRNPEPGPGLPLVLFGYPRDWKPQSIRFVVTFLDDPPEHAWALVADSVLDVGFGHERTGLVVEDGMVRCRIDNPRRDQLYGVGWEGPAETRS